MQYYYYNLKKKKKEKKGPDMIIYNILTVYLYIYLLNITVY